MARISVRYRRGGRKTRRPRAWFDRQKGYGGRTNRYGKRMSGMRSTMNANKDHATVVEAQELSVLANGGNFMSHNLQEFPRALAVSKNFRFYRCKKVEVEFVPYSNVFQAGTSFPELYFQVDRTQGNGLGPGLNVPVPTKAIMLSRGVLPVKWTTPLRRSYVPSVLRNENFIQNVQPDNFVSSVAAITSTPVKYKWYMTQQYFSAPPGAAASVIQPSWGPQYLQYFGAAFFIDQPVAPQGVCGTLKCKVHWEFKQPLVATAPSSVDVSGGVPTIQV